MKDKEISRKDAKAQRRKINIWWGGRPWPPGAPAGTEARSTSHFKFYGWAYRP